MFNRRGVVDPGAMGGITFPTTTYAHDLYHYALAIFVVSGRDI